MMFTNNGYCITPTIKDLFKSSPQCKFMTSRCYLRCPVWEQANHHFPNHKKNHDRFKAWVEAIDGKLETEEDYEFFRTKRLCHIHFKPIFCYNDRRLSSLAIPTLYLTKESRDEYWSKDLELRKSMLQSNSPQDELVKAEADRPKGVAETPKCQVKTRCEEPLMDVPKEISPLINTQKSLRLDVQESLVNLLITDILGDENINKVDDVQKKESKKEKHTIDLSAPSPVQPNVPSPVADIIITYYPTIEDSPQKFVMENIPRYITKSKGVENLAPEPIFIHDFPLDSTVLETYAEEIEIKSSCIQQPKKKRKSKYDGVNWDQAPRIPMEHNYSKASIIDSTSHISSNGVHPKNTIITLKRQVRDLRKKLMFYKQKCKDLLLINQNQQTVTHPIKRKTITKISQKGQSHKKAYKNVRKYLKLKNVGGISLPRNINFINSIPYAAVDLY